MRAWYRHHRIPGCRSPWSNTRSQHHDDVIKWKHFPRYWPFVRGIHRSGDFPAQRPVTRSFDVFFDLRPNIQYWVNNREVGDLRRHRCQYDVNIMTLPMTRNNFEWTSRTRWSQFNEISRHFRIYFQITGSWSLIGVSCKNSFNLSRHLRTTFRLSDILKIVYNIMLCLDTKIDKMWQKQYKNLNVTPEVKFIV